MSAWFANVCQLWNILHLVGLMFPVQSAAVHCETVPFTFAKCKHSKSMCAVIAGAVYQMYDNEQEVVYGIEESGCVTGTRELSVHTAQ